MEPALRPATIGLPPRVADSVTTYLRDQILSGTLRAGQRLRVEHIAAELQTSITPVRESLLELLGEGFVDREPRRGYMVAALGPDDIRDVYVALADLSAELAARATARMGPEQVDELESLQRALEDALHRRALDEMETVNHTFHGTINRRAGAPKLVWFVQRAARYAPRWTWTSIEGWPDAAAGDHGAILDAFRQRDAGRAREAMSLHMRHSGELLIGHLADHGFWSGPSDD